MHRTDQPAAREDNSASVLYRALAKILPAKIAAVFTSESLILRSALFGPRGKNQSYLTGKSPEVFTYATTGPLRYLWLIVLVGAVPEVWLMHLLLPHHRNIETALIAITVWSLVWFLGYYRVLRDHPHTVERDTATLRFGFRRSCTVPFPSVVTAKTSRAFTQGASPRALAPYQKWERFCVNHCDLVELTLSPQAIVEEFTGERHEVARLAVSFDDANAFLQAMERSRTS